MVELIYQTYPFFVGWATKKPYLNPNMDYIVNCTSTPNCGVLPDLL